MNPSNQTQTPEQLSSIPTPFLQNSFQLSFYLPQSNPNPSTNSTSNPTSNLNHYLSLSVPRKRRRGRPRSGTSTLQPQTQVFNIPSFSNGTINANNAFGSSSSSHAFAIPNAKLNATSTGVVPDTSDEIIVINKEATSEALIALSAGFPADSLTDEEIDAGVVRSIGGIEQVNYILIRNHIITKWRENVTNWVDKEMFIDVIPPHYGTLLDSAYMFLVSHGYINFGVAPGIKEKVPSEPCKPRVVIIGAGLAGLAAARQLMAFGFKVTVLEGRKRAGGRVYTKKMEGGNRSAAADLGGSVLTGTLGNPLGILARQLSYSLHKVRDKCPLYCMDGKPVDPDTDMKVEAAFNRLLDKAGRIRQLMGEVSVDVSLGAALETFRQVYGDAVKEDEMNLFNWHLANLEYANAGLLSKLSLAFWDQDDPYDMGGDHCFLPGGNGRLVQALAENVPILYERTVHTIRYGSDGVQVIAGSQGFEADMALCTVPLGVLKGGSVKFIPELPQRKLDGIKRLGFGLLNKVAMLFPHVFWGTDLDTFGHLTEDSSRRGEFFLFYSYVTLAGGPLLIALVAGEAAHKFETMPPTDAVAQVLQILRGIYEPQGIDVPEPIQTVCTRWGSDPFSLGSYSNVAVGASGDDYDILAESVGDGRVFFAGEATTRRYPATMHGAFLSGLREAANMAHYANVRTSKMKLERTPSKNAHSCASLLADLFREPDLEFGSFSVIFGKKSPDTKSTAILRVAFSGARSKSTDGSKPDQQYSNKLLFQQLQSHFNQQQELHVYTLLSRQQALELREVRGGDDMRLNHLCEKLGVKLVCRKGLGPAADSVIASVKAERGNRKPSSASLALKSGISKRKTSTLKQKMVRRAKVVSNQLVPRAKIAAGGDVSTSIAHTSGGMGPPPNGNMDRPPIPNMGQPPSVSMGPPPSLNRVLPTTADTGQPADANMGSLPDTKMIQPTDIGTLQPLDVNVGQPPNTNLGFPQPPVANMGPTPDLSMRSTPEMNMGSTSNANISSLSVGNAGSVLEANISSPMHTNMGSTAGVNMCSTPYINMGSTLDANVGSNSMPVLNMVPDSDANIDPPLEAKMDLHPNINMCPPLDVNANTGPILTTNSVPSADVSLAPFPEWNMALSTEWNMPSPTEWNMAPPCEWNLAPSSVWNITPSNSNLLSTHMLNVAPPNLDGMCPSTIEGPSSTVVGLEPPFEWPSNPNQLPSDMVNPVTSNLDVTPPSTIVEGPFSSTDVVLPSSVNMMNEKMTEDK